MQNPLSPAFPETMYRTGDVAVLDDEGRFVYRGRKDHQIKHLGQRIELGEIDATAHATDGVERACTVYEPRKKRILLFYVGACEKDSLAATLKDVLPQYMVPNKIRQLGHDAPHQKRQDRPPGAAGAKMSETHWTGTSVSWFPMRQMYLSNVSHCPLVP